MSLAHEVITLFAAKYKFIKRVQVNQVVEYVQRLVAGFDSNYAAIVSELNEVKAISPELETKMKEAMEILTTQYLKMSGK